MMYSTVPEDCSLQYESGPAGDGDSSGKEIQKIKNQIIGRTEIKSVKETMKHFKSDFEVSIARLNNMKCLRNTT